MSKIFPHILDAEFQPLQPLMKSLFVLFFGDGFEIVEIALPSWWLVSKSLPDRCDLRIPPSKNDMI